MDVQVLRFLGELALKPMDQREFEIPAPLKVAHPATLHLDATAVSRPKSP